VASSTSAKPHSKQQQSNEFGSTGFNYKGKKEDSSFSKTNYSGAPWVKENMNTEVGELATTDLETLSNNHGMERTATNWGDRGEKKRNLKKIKPHLRGLDFQKLLSRDYLDKLYGDKRTVIPFSKPSYNYVTSRKFKIYNHKRTNYVGKVRSNA